MEEIVSFFVNNKVDLQMLFFLIIFVQPIALFHTLIVIGVLKFNLPNWLFFAIDSLLVFSSFFIDNRLPLLIIFILFLSVFLLMIFGIIFKSATKKNKSINKTPWYLKILGFILIIIILSSFYYIMEYKLWKLIFIIFPILLIVKNIFFKSSNAKFLKLQALLPTSKIGSIAMGMIEIKGDLEQIQPLISPYFNKECIGYFYRIEEEGPTDDNGNTSYHTVFFEQKIGVFNILDETGSVKIDGTNLEFYEKSVSRSEGRKKRHSEGYLLHNDYKMLIGYATSENGNTLIVKGDKNNVFIIANPNEIDFYNSSLPLLNNLLITLYIVTILILFILSN